MGLGLGRGEAQKGEVREKIIIVKGGVIPPEERGMGAVVPRGAGCRARPCHVWHEDAVSLPQPCSGTQERAPFMGVPRDGPSHPFWSMDFQALPRQRSHLCFM